MRKKQITILLALLTVLLLGVDAFGYIGKDRKAPVIEIPDSVIDKGYNGEDEEDLLKGVTATDNRDGDVSDTLRVSEILENGNGKSVTVTYVAKDQSRNVAAKSVVLKKKK